MIRKDLLSNTFWPCSLKVDDGSDDDNGGWRLSSFSTSRKDKDAMLCVSDLIKYSSGTSSILLFFRSSKEKAFRNRKSPEIESRRMDFLGNDNDAVRGEDVKRADDEIIGVEKTLSRLDLFDFLSFASFLILLYTISYRLFRLFRSFCSVSSVRNGTPPSACQSPRSFS